MKKVLESDPRFIHITGCRIRGLYRKVPKTFGGWKIDISYEENEDDIFPVFRSIEIDQRSFGENLLKTNFEKGEKMILTYGMTDIDMYKKGDDYIIYYSINDGSYIYFFFTAEEFLKLYNWLSLDT